MIIQCEECRSKFDLDESLIKKSGSKVRCSVCKNIFEVYPPESESVEEPPDDDFINEALEETVSLDSPPSFEEMESDDESFGEELDEDFDKAFEDALEQDIQEVPLDEISDIDDEAQPAGAVDERGEILLDGTDSDRGFSSISSTRKKHGRSRTLLIALLIILALVIGALFVFFFSPDILPDSLSSLKPVDKEEITDTGIRKLVFKDVNGDFLQSNKLGQLFIIKGSVINNNPRSRSLILLNGTILDDKGNAIRKKLVYAGNTFEQTELKEMSLEEIDEALKNQAGRDNINVNVKPGDSVPFMIVFENLPENLSEFIVEAVSSSPGK